MEQTKIDRIKELLEKSGIPAFDLQVYGTIRVNIIATCEGFDTCNRWLDLLSQFCSKVRMCESVLYNKDNRGTCLNPTRRHCYRVYGYIA